MKTKFLLLALAAAALTLAGCAREEEMPGSVKVPRMTIRVSVPEEPVSKASFSVPGSGTGLHVAWQAGDKIRVINHANPANNALYDIQAGFTDHVASFSGPVVSGDYFDVICPGSYASVDAAAAGNAALTQTGNGNTDHLVFTAKLGNVAKADLPDITFSDDWAAEHPGTTFNRGGIMKMVLTLPNAVTEPKKVVLSGFGEDISVNIDGVSLTSEHVLTAYAQCGWDDIEIMAGIDFTVRVMDADGSVYASTKTITADKTLKAGAQNIIKVTDGFAEKLFMGGDGTEASPYLIASAKQLDNMHADDPETGDPILKHQERVYFRLIDDIDMADYLSANRWVPLNAVNPYDYIIDFDGNNHTIDHFSCSFDSSMDDGNTQKDPSFFGLLYGSCYDVTFTNATITANDGPCGIIGGYVGYTGKKAVIYNVHVSGTVTRTGGSGVQGTGGLAGIMVYSYIDSCSSTADVTSSRDFTGGLVGRDSDDASRIRNCWTSGTVYGNQKMGGIIGGVIRPETEVINCFSIATVNAMRFAGGIVGDACLDAGSSNHYKDAGTLTPDNVIKGCIAWQTSLVTRDQGGVKDGWASGAIIGLTATHNYLTDCKRNSAMVFDDFSDELTLYDQANSNPSTPLVVVNPNSGTYKHYSPYHGKSYSGTLSDCARSLGWDESVWDLSGSTPVLTGAVQVDPPAEVPVSGDANIPNVATTSRAFPANNYTSQGLTWTVSEIRTGIRYYRGYGNPTDSWWADKYSTSAAGQCQEIFVVDLDLSNTDYDVKIVVVNPTTVTSEVFRQTGAIAAINGGYEKASIAVKANMFLNSNDEEFTNYPSGYPYSFMPNNTIGDTGVANWKSEGAFYSDGHRNVRIAFDAYDGGATGKTSTGSTSLKSVKYMRNFYKTCTDGEAGFISSAPILDANYVRFGMSFYSRAASGSNGESPKVHQGSCYSRTAVGIAYPNGDENEPHLLLICNDGKYTNGTRGYGMSAYQLERVIANFFGPKYLLNLDGGGSTTMCVEGKGDEDTHVVNYPSDNYTGKAAIPNTDPVEYYSGIVDHGGERARDTFIVIVPAE